MKSLAKQAMNQTKVFVQTKRFLEKPDVPLRTVINELGTWQCSVSKVSSLNVVQLEKSPSLRNLEAQIKALGGFMEKSSTLSMDIKDFILATREIPLVAKSQASARVEFGKLPIQDRYRRKQTPFSS